MDDIEDDEQMMQRNGENVYAANIVVCLCVSLYVCVSFACVCVV